VKVTLHVFQHESKSILINAFNDQLIQIVLFDEIYFYHENQTVKLKKSWKEKYDETQRSQFQPEFFRMESKFGRFTLFI